MFVPWLHSKKTETSFTVCPDPSQGWLKAFMKDAFLTDTCPEEDLPPYFKDPCAVIFVSCQKIIQFMWIAKREL